MKIACLATFASSNEDLAIVVATIAKIAAKFASTYYDFAAIFVGIAIVYSCSSAAFAFSSLTLLGCRRLARSCCFSSMFGCSR